MKTWPMLAFIIILQSSYATASKGNTATKLNRIVEEAFIGETKQIRRRAKAQLRQADILAIPALRKALKSPNPAVRRGAAKWLARHGAKAASALSDLLASMKDTDSQVQSFSAKALAKIGNKAIPGLLALMKHEQAYVREQAISAISQFQSQSKVSVQALIDTLKDRDNMVRWAALKALSKVSSFPGAISSIIERVGDNEPYIRREAIKIINRHGAKAAKVLVL